MTPQTPTSPPNDRTMWRRLIARAHPDAGGDHDLFVWAQATRGVICGGGLASIERKPRATSRGTDNRDRVRFVGVVDHELLIATAMHEAERVGEPYARLLGILADCEEAQDGPLYKMQDQGATYKTLAAIAHRAGMSKEQRVRFYRIAEEIPMSQRMAGHIISHLRGGSPG